MRAIVSSRPPPASLRLGWECVAHFTLQYSTKSWQSRMWNCVPLQTEATYAPPCARVPTRSPHTIQMEHRNQVGLPVAHWASPSLILYLSALCTKREMTSPSSLTWPNPASPASRRQIFELRISHPRTDFIAFRSIFVCGSAPGLCSWCLALPRCTARHFFP